MAVDERARDPAAGQLAVELGRVDAEQLAGVREVEVLGDGGPETGRHDLREVSLRDRRSDATAR